MENILKHLGYSDRLIRTLNSDEQDFLITNNDILPNIRKHILEIYPDIPEDKILKSILSTIRGTGDDVFGGDKFYNNIKDIIKKSQRDFKISQVLGESKVYSFIEFSKLF